MPNAFIALDVETANADPASICQIGLATFVDEQVTDAWLSYIDPETSFDPINVDIHGITPQMVRGAPKISKLLEILQSTLVGSIVVHHTPFDRLSLNRAAENNSVSLPSLTWLDSARVIRRAYPEYRQAGYGLSNLANVFGITYHAHNALEDARTAGLVLLAAIKSSNVSLDEWTTRAYQKIRYTDEIERQGNPDGPLYGETIVFTGALSISRREAAKLAADAGCNTEDTVTKRTTILVVGTQNLYALAGKDKSSKHHRAEELISHGQPIRIISEADFKAIVRDY